MNTYFYSIAGYAVNSFKQIVLPKLTVQQKRISIVVVIALTFLVSCYLACRYCFRTSSLKEEKQDIENITALFYAETESKVVEKISSPQSDLQNDLEKECNLSELPEDILISIFKQLDYPTWRNYLYFNKKLHDICLNPNVISSLLEENRIPHDSKNKEVILNLAERLGPRLTKLNLGNMEFSEDELKQISHACPNLKCLILKNLNNPHATAEILEYLPASLEILDLSCCQTLNDKNLEHLKRFSSLKSLTLICCYTINNSSFKHFQVLSNLEALCLNTCSQLTGEGLEHLQVLSHLKALDLGNCYNIDQAGLQYLQNLSALESLNLEDCNVTSLEFLKNLSHLQSLDLSLCPDINDNEFEYLKDLLSLKHLDLTDCQVTSEGLKHLQNLSALQSLNLSGCKIKNLKYLPIFSHLQSLDLSYCKINDDSLEYLQKLSPALQFLSLNSCTEITDNGLEYIQGLSFLQRLDLQSCTKITDQGLKYLQDLSTLQFLY